MQPKTGEEIEKEGSPLNRSIAAHFDSRYFEGSYFGEDLGESICEAVELVLRSAAGE